MLIFLTGMVFLSVLLIVMHIFSQRETDIEIRLRSIGFSDPKKLTPEEAELERPFQERILKPILQKLTNLMSRFTPAGAKLEIKRKLIRAGNPKGMQVQDFLTMKGVACLGLPLGFGLMLFLGKLPMIQILIFMSILFIFGYKAPDFWLKSLIQRRQKAIQKALPDVLDLLCVSVEAGLGFDSAVSKVVEKTKGPIAQEFFRMLQEVKMNKPRREAMRDLADRVDLPDLSTFIASLIQADQLGVSIAKVLRIQSEQMRIRRRLRAQEQAQKAAVKMIFPMVFFIFPSMFIVLLGPVLLQIMQTSRGQ